MQLETIEFVPYDATKPQVSYLHEFIIQSEREHKNSKIKWNVEEGIEENDDRSCLKIKTMMKWQFWKLQWEFSKIITAADMYILWM